MVHRAQRPGVGVGGHISTYASSASLYEVGFNHFFRGRDHAGGGDQIYIQGHASPGIYARAFLEGRLDEDRLDGFRQELSHPGGGLPSYPHPRLMPDFWEFPTVSMGLGPINAIYQAQFNRYLHNRGIKDTSDQHVWAFLGDGEMDEVESLGAIGLAAREELDNLTFVVNCNLQRLDGPVRGNGKIIQELEAFFRGAGWNVIKVIWGRSWDPLLAQDSDGALVNIMNTTPDGDFQTYKSEDGGFIREHFFGRDPRTRKMVEDMDRRPDLGAAARRARLPQAVRRLPVSDRAQGPADGHPGQDHQGLDARVPLRGPQLHAPDEEADAGGPQGLPRPAGDPHRRRPDRRETAAVLPPRRRQRHHALPARAPTGARRLSAQATEPSAGRWCCLATRSTKSARRGAGKQQVATTMAFVRLLKDLLKDPEIGQRIVPIIPDEARTFGMDAMFPVQKIYNPHGQTYVSVDRELMLSYKEATDGQLLHQGINEAGSAASFTAAGTSYATHDEPMIPVYIFYSMFGFQRTADAFWAAADQMTRGFLIGATAGRTTLNGEGLQHEDGHSPLLAATNPAVVTLRPGVRLRDRSHRPRRPAADVRRGRREHLLLPHDLQRTDRPAG